MKNGFEDETLMLQTIYEMVSDIQEGLKEKKPLLLTPAQAAEAIGVSVDTVRVWIKRDNPEERIPGVWVNQDGKSKPWGHYRVIADAIPGFLRKEAQR